MFIIINYFLLVVNILALWSAGWTIATLIDKWTIVVCINEKSATYELYYNSMQNATIFMIAATDKRVM